MELKMIYRVYALQNVIPGDNRKRWYRNRDFDNKLEATHYGDNLVETNPLTHAFKIKEVATK